MPPLGAHMSIAGGYFRAVETARECGCDCVQLFTKNNNQWQGKALTADDCHRFQRALAELNIGHPLSHDSYLINLASPDEALWRRSIDAFVVELQRADALGIPYVVTHPGSYTTSSEQKGLERVIAAIDAVHRATPKLRARCLLECTAGQGTNLGWRFEHLATILDGVKHSQRLGVCLDTCHLFAAGYALAPRSAYLATFRQFEKLVGTERIMAFHLNDSVKGLGCRVDRHAHIGEGKMGLEPFRHLLNDRRFRDIPMYLETPKGLRDGQQLDVINLQTLRGLMASSPKRTRSTDKPRPKSVKCAN